MNCPDCGYANPDDAGFCGECGASLARDILCPNCGRQNPARQKFCHGCGQRFTSEPERDTRSYTPKHLADKILQSKSALEGERKQVTVLFADITGSMALAGQVDPEEWHSILDRYFQIASDGVHRFEGTVNQYTGDGIMALFGAPIAHEDHAQRACYAALRLREELKRYAEDVKRRHGLGFSFRLGLNSGDVVVGKIGDDLRMDYTAQGVTVGLAERMEQLAAADSAYVSDATARLVQGYFELRDLDEFSLKGVREPVRVHELQGVGALRTRLDASRARGFSKFVGRDRELASLESALEEAIAGNGQVVGIVADAGTGKSRLCAEFVEQCLARGIRVNQAHCPAHGKTIPYLPLLEMLRDIFDIDERDSDHEARRKITGELMLLDDRFRELLPLLFDFLGVPDPERPAPNVSPEGRQQQLFAFVRHLSQARSEREPAVIFLDDLHWIDPGSDAFLAHAVEGAPGTRTLYLVNFRPEYHAEWMKKSFYRQLPLQPLGREAIEELLADLLGSDLSVAALPARIHERTGGNPFFIEEVVQSLVEGGNLEGERGGYRLTEPVEMLEIPGTVQSVLAARIDRLAEQEKQLLQRASVINKEFAEPILKRVAELPDSDLAASLSALVLAEFLLEKALYPEAEYAFKHPLTQEVAYHSQLAERRAALHAAVARAVEEIDADRLDERAALLGYHWEEAGEPPAAARWYARAARSAGVATPVESLRHWEKVWAILDRPPTSEEASSLLVEAASELLQLGYRQGVSAERAEAIYDEGRQLADRADVTESVKLRYGYGVVNMLSGNLRRAVAVLEEGVALADPTGDPELRFGAREPLWAAHAFLGDLEAALRVNAEKIEIAANDPHVGKSIVAYSEPWQHGAHGWVLTDLARFEEAAECFRRCEEGERRLGETEQLAWNDAFRSRFLERAGDTAGAIAAARRAVETAEKVGSRVALALAYGAHGTSLALHEEWEAARARLEQVLEISRESRVWLSGEADHLAVLAEVHLGLGDPVAARRTAEEAIEAARLHETPICEVRARLALARVLLALDGDSSRAQVEVALDRALELVYWTGARSFEPFVYEERARLAGLLSDNATRDREISKAHRLFNEIGAVGHAERVGRELANAAE